MERPMAVVCVFLPRVFDVEYFLLVSLFVRRTIECCVFLRGCAVTAGFGEAKLQHWLSSVSLAWRPHCYAFSIPDVANRLGRPLAAMFASAISTKFPWFTLVNPQ